MMKKLLQRDSSVMLSLENWCLWLEIVPLEVPECKCIFCRMLVACKITKFKEVNYKILSQILVTPKVLARIRSAENIHWCIWCGGEASLEHILLECQAVQDLHTKLCQNLQLPRKMKLQS